jgi:hypothetical protein
MRRSPAFTSFIALLSSVAACAGHSATESTQPRLDQVSSSGAKVEILAEGGFAALSLNHVVRHDDRYFLFTQRRICNGVCPAIDSASGSLSAAATDSIFKIVLPASVGLKDDYGVTRGGADMMSYTIRLTMGGSTKTITADDGTMPPELRQIVSAVHQSIEAARR